MKKKFLSLDEMKKALLEAEKLEEASSSENDKSSVAFSDGFEERMKNILGDTEEQKQYARSGMSPGKKIAFILVAAVLMIALAIGVVALTGGGWSIALNDKGDHYEVSVVPDENITDNRGEVIPPHTAEPPPTYIKEVYKPTRIPAKSEEILISNISGVVIEYYDDDDKFVASYSQFPIDAQICVDSEHSTVKDCKVGESTGKMFIPTDGSSQKLLIWTDGRYTYQITSEKDENDIIIMGESVERMESTEDNSEHD